MRKRLTWRVNTGTRSNGWLRLKACVIGLLAAAGASADNDGGNDASLAAPFTLANIYSSGCVLQRDQKVSIWGTGTPGETVTVAIKAQSRQTVTDANGDWMVKLDPESAGGPYTLTASGGTGAPLTLTDVYFGDVWLLTGQSNMCITLGNQLNNYPEYYPSVPDASDNFDDVRFASIMVVENKLAPAADVAMEKPWNRWEATELNSMSAVGYFFVRALNAALDANGMEGVPLGVIKVCKGATTAEQWISSQAIAAMPEPLIEDPTRSPSGYYNGMISPIQDYAVKGAVWYQGEGNSRTIERAEQYPLVMKTLIESWRAQWGTDFPFYFVQLAPFMPFTPVPADEDTDRNYINWAWLRESQTECLSINKTGMACIIDGGIQNDIHPPFKNWAGERLARIAAADTYGIDTVSRGPTVADVQINGPEVLITFDNVADGLQTQAVDSQPDAVEIAEGFPPVSVSSSVLAGFALCGSDRVFYWATEAEIIGPNQVRISNLADVPQPVAIRYAWQSYPRCNLFNSEGLPAEPFRTDDYPYGAAEGAALTQPPLEIISGGTELMLCWPPLPDDWAMQSTEDLSNWLEVEGSRGTTSLSVTTSAVMQTQFFRLKIL